MSYSCSTLEHDGSEIVRRKSVSFFDIDTVHYYDSDDTSESCSSMSSAEREGEHLSYQNAQIHIFDLIQEKTSEEKTGPYFRIDLPFKLPVEYIEPLQNEFNADFDFVGEFFTDIYMYEVWSRK